MRQRTFAQLAVSQALMLRRNVAFWMISLFIAVISMLVFGWLFKPEAQPFKLALVDEDQTQSSQSLASVFSALDNVKYETGTRPDELGALKDGDRAAVVILPQGFETALQGGHASIQAYFDNSNPTRIGYVTSTVAAVAQSYSEKVSGRGQAVAVDPQAVETETTRFIDFLTPGMVGMTIMFTNLAVGFLMVTWREQGILRRLGVTPLRPGVFIASQAVSFSLVSIAQVTALLVIARLVFNVQMQGSYLLLAVTGGLGILCMLSLGYTIASFARTVTSFSAIQQLLAFPMLFLGRSYFPIDPPASLKPIVEAVPLTHLNDALREIVNHGGGPSDVWISWLVLAAWAFTGYIVSMRLFRWQ
jgi:ABC-2 type transport system permease protein